MQYERELEAALEASRRAGQVILDLYARFREIPDAPADISTEADRRSQETILDHLHRVFPGDALCAEESTPAFADLPAIGPRMWIVDPIDGTRGFARKNGEFSVMVGFVTDGISVVGVVLEPALERLTYAVRDAGCWRRDNETETAVACRVSSTTDLPSATLIQSHSHKDGPPSRQLQALKPASVVATYSAGIKLARVARGEADLYLNTYPAFRDWDACAGHVLVEEAGGRVTGLAGEEIRYGQPGARHEVGLLATNGRLHAPALAALKVS
jgi:3'(2'), 5'-bisphosphate nucleotidase